VTSKRSFHPSIALARANNSSRTREERIKDGGKRVRGNPSEIAPLESGIAYGLDEDSIVPPNCRLTSLA
jgi:hypothetical protein